MQRHGRRRQTRTAGGGVGNGATRVDPRAARKNHHELAVGSEAVLQLELAQLKHEVFAVLFLDVQNRLLSFQPMFRGSLAQTMVYPREVAKLALALGADGVVLAHNHPSGSTKPSHSDMLLTRTMQESLALIDVTVRDHIIVAQGKYLSMAEEGLM